MTEGIASTPRMDRRARLSASAWMGTVMLDGVDVSLDCTAVDVDGESAISVTLYLKNEQGKHFKRWNEERAEYEIAREVRTGTITFQLRPRPKYSNAEADER